MSNKADKICHKCGVLCHGFYCRKCVMSSSKTRVNTLRKRREKIDNDDFLFQ